MTRSVILCLRLCDAPKDAASHLKLWHLLEESQSTHSARTVGWGADRFSMAFPEQEGAAALAFASVLLSAMGEQAIGIAAREAVLERESSRVFGAGLSLAEALAEAARPGEILIDPELTSTGTLERLGTATLRFGGEVLRAHLCVRALEPRSRPGSVALPRLTPPPPPSEGPFSPTRNKLSSLPNLSTAMPVAPPPPEAPRLPTPVPSPPKPSTRPAPAPPGAPGPAPSAAAPVAAVPAAPASPLPPSVEDGNIDRPSHARVSLRPASPSAPPFRKQRSRGPSERLSTPPPKPSRAPLDAASRGAPPPKPSKPPEEEDPDPAERTTIPSDPPARSETELSLESSLVELAQGETPGSAPPASSRRGVVAANAGRLTASEGGLPLEPDVAEALNSADDDAPSSAPGAAERPSVVEALRSGDPEALQSVAEQLRADGAEPALVERLGALAHLAQGEVSSGLGTLRDAAAQAKSQGDDPSRSALALAVGLAMAGKRDEALLQGLEALALARSRADRRGEHASTAFLGQLSRSAGHPAVSDAWLRASSKHHQQDGETDVD